MWTVTRIIDDQEQTVSYKTAAEALKHASNSHREVISSPEGIPLPFEELRQMILRGEVV